MTELESGAPAQQSAPRQPWYKKGAVRLGACIWGIPIYVHWTFFLLLALMILSTLINGATDGKMWGVILLLYGPILMVTIIIVSTIKYCEDILLFSLWTQQRNTSIHFGTA